MPVVNLPQDTRFGDLGKGLGGLVGAIAQGVQQQQAQAGVAEVMQDQTMSEPQKYAKILKDHGTLGQELYTKAVQNQFMQSRIKDITSEIGKRTVETAAAQAKLDQEFPEQLTQLKTKNRLLGTEAAGQEALLPGLVPAQAASTELTRQKAVETGAKATQEQALTPGIVPAQTAKTKLLEKEAGKTDVETDVLGAKGQEQLIKNEVQKIQLEMLKGITTEAGATSKLDERAKSFGLTPAQAELAKGAWLAEKDPLKKDEAYIKEVARLPSAPVDVRKETGADAEAAISSKKFLDVFRKGGAEKLGFADVFSTGNPMDLAAVKGMMEKRGLSTGDPEFVSMFNSSLQQIASAATAGGGIGFAQGRVDLAKETTATISQSPLHALIALDETADRKLAKLQNMRKNMSPSEPREGVDDAIKHYQDVKAITGTLNAYVVDKGAPGERQVVLFDGSQVDPKTFKKIVDGKKEYKVGSGFGTGAEFVEQARVRNLDPETYIKQLQAKFGAGAR
jgi:hypothetical protein